MKTIINSAHNDNTGSVEKEFGLNFWALNSFKGSLNFFNEEVMNNFVS